MLWEAEKARIRHMACPFLFLGLVATVYTCYFYKQWSNQSPYNAVDGVYIICEPYDIDVNYRFHLLQVFGTWIYAITASVCFLGFLTAGLGLIAPTLCMLKLHSICACTQIALFVTIGCWRFDAAGAYCSTDDGHLNIDSSPLL